MSPIVSGKEVVIGVRVTIPPNVTPEQAHAMMSNNGISMPLGLLPFVRQTHVSVVDANEPVTIPPLEDGGVLSIHR